MDSLTEPSAATSARLVDCNAFLSSFWGCLQEAFPIVNTPTNVAAVLVQAISTGAERWVATNPQCCCNFRFFNTNSGSLEISMYDASPFADNSQVLVSFTVNFSQDILPETVSILSRMFRHSVFAEGQLEAYVE